MKRIRLLIMVTIVVFTFITPAFAEAEVAEEKILLEQLETIDSSYNIDINFDYNTTSGEQLLHFDSIEEFEQFVKETHQTTYSENITVEAPNEDAHKDEIHFIRSSKTYDITGSSKVWRPYLSSSILCFHNVRYSGTYYYDDGVPKFNSIDSCNTWITGIKIAATYKDKGYSKSFFNNQRSVKLETYGTMTLGVEIKGFTIGYTFNVDETYTFNLVPKN